MAGTTPRAITLREKLVGGEVEVSEEGKHVRINALDRFDEAPLDFDAHDARHLRDWLSKWLEATKP